jgi:hypothetical protein
MLSIFITKRYISSLYFTGAVACVARHESTSQSVLHLGEHGVGEKILKCEMTYKGVPRSKCEFALIYFCGKDTLLYPFPQIFWLRICRPNHAVWKYLPDTCCQGGQAGAVKF